MKLQHFLRMLLSSVEWKTFNNVSESWAGSEALVDPDYILGVQLYQSNNTEHI